MTGSIPPTPDAAKLFDELLVTYVQSGDRKAAERLSLDPETVQKAHPNLIHCAAIGFGRGGPYENDAAYDDVVQALSGFASVNANAAGEPRFVPQIIVDKLTAMFVVEAVLTALFHRERTGKAEQIEVPKRSDQAALGLADHLVAEQVDRVLEVTRVIEIIERMGGRALTPPEARNKLNLRGADG